MKNNISALVLGVSLSAAALLAGCGGGTSPVASLPGSTPATNTAASAMTSGTKVTLTIDRTPSTGANHPHTQGGRSAQAAHRSPQYLSQSVGGLQVAVSAGGVTKTIYADISQTSPLCAYNATTYVETCTLIAPTLGTSETIAAIELAQTPNNEVTTGAGAGYGDGFATDSQILAVANLTQATVPGTVTSIPLALNPVWQSEQAYLVGTNGSNLNASVDSNGGNPRYLVTQGVAQTATFYDCFYDAAHNERDANPQGLKFVDVNGSPAPMSVLSSTNAVTFAAAPSSTANVSTVLPTLTYTTSASAPDESYIWLNCETIFGLKTDGTQTADSAITLSLNRSAAPPAPFVGNSAQPNVVLPLHPIKISAATATVAVTGSTTATITGTDGGATNGLYAQGAHDPLGNETTGTGGQCLDADGTTVRATVAGAAINTTTWQQVFTITPLMAGTCTFTIADENTGTLGGTLNGTTLITVTVNP